MNRLTSGQGLSQPHHRLLAGIALACLAFLATAAEPYHYDAGADPAREYRQALQQAGDQGKLVLLVFGAEWCPDCRSLNRKMTETPLAETVDAGFVVAHVDIGNWDRNMDFTAQFGEPVSKGIPSIAIVAADGTVLYVSKAGEFASARSAELSSLDAWFRDRLEQLGSPHQGGPVGSD